MSKTLRIVNGQLDIDPGSGQPVLLEGNRKAAQDLGEVLLQDYLAEQDYGSFLRAVATNKIPFSGDLFIRYYISDAVKRLQAKQQIDPNITDAERIDAIVDLLTVDDGNGNIAFYVNCSTADGGAAQAAAAQETQLNQQFERFDNGSSV